MRDDPMMTDIMFPNAERAIRKFKAREALADPKTAAKNDEAASCFDTNSSAFGTTQNMSVLLAWCLFK